MALNQPSYLSYGIPFKTVATSAWKMRRSHFVNASYKSGDRTYPI
ncbi:hypothetical protein [Nostoc sp.]